MYGTCVAKYPKHSREQPLQSTLQPRSPGAVSVRPEAAWGCAPRCYMHGCDSLGFGCIPFRVVAARDNHPFLGAHPDNSGM